MTQINFKAFQSRLFRKGIKVSLQELREAALFCTEFEDFLEHFSSHQPRITQSKSVSYVNDLQSLINKLSAETGFDDDDPLSLLRKQSIGLLERVAKNEALITNVLKSIEDKI